MRYSMQYLKTENVHLIKDMGMIPYKLHKLYNFDSTVITYRYGEYPYLEHEVKGLKIEFVKRLFRNFSLDGAVHLIKHSKNIDILQIFHCTMSSVVYAYTYKLFNKKGKIYLKLDCSHKLVERIGALNHISKWFLNIFLDTVDLISVEQEELFHRLKNILNKQSDKFINIPNGIDFDKLEEYDINYDYEAKENTILTVARLGAEEKNTMMLLEAYAGISGVEKLPWKLKLIGKIEEGFKKEIENFFDRYPKLIGKVIFTGSIEDRKQLYKEYAKSKIFCLTSDFESFGIAFIEAAALGNVIIATDVGIAKEIVIANNGSLVPVRDTQALTKSLEKFIKHQDLEANCKFTADLCSQKFNWDRIVEKLYKELQKII